MTAKRRIMRKEKIIQVNKRNNRKRNKLQPRKEQKVKKKLKRLQKNQQKLEKMKRMKIMIMRKKIITMEMTMMMKTQAVQVQQKNS